MKLKECIIMGKFMGLQTINECISNYELHYIQTLPYDKVAKDRNEIYEEYNKYFKGELKLDWDAIDKEVNKQLEDMNKYFDDKYEII